jgi:hypothetical protein
VFRFLNELYARYDKVVDDYRVYKVRAAATCLSPRFQLFCAPSDC